MLQVQVKDWLQVGAPLLQTVAIGWAAFKVVGKAEREFQERSKQIADTAIRVDVLEQWKDTHGELASHWIARVESLEKTVEREFDRVRDRLDQALDHKKP